MLSCYWFDDIIKFEDFDFDNTLIDEKSHPNILIYDILYKILIGPKPLHIRFSQVDGFIRVYYRSRFLVLFGINKYETIRNRIRYVIGVNGNIIYISLHYYAKVKVDFCNSLPLERTLTLHSVKNTHLVTC